MKLVAAALTLGVFSSASVEAQSIADIARQERARQQSVQSTITVTNESVSSPTPVGIAEPVAPKVEPPSAPPTVVIIPIVTQEPPASQVRLPIVPAVVQPLAVKEVQPAEKLVAPTHDETWWRNAFEDARHNLKGAEDRVITLQVSLSQARLDSLAKRGETRLAVEITRLTKELDSAQKDVVKGRQKISQLDDELRRSGGLPEWAR